MFLYLIALFVSFALCQNELGLIVRSSNAELDEIPVRLVNGQLSAGKHGPLLQAFFDDSEHLILSHQLVSKNFTGSGLGLTAAQQLVIKEHPDDGFYARGGWLEHGANAVFYAQQSDDQWLIYRTPGESTNASPVMLEIAGVEYETNHLESMHPIDEDDDPMSFEDSEVQSLDQYHDSNIKEPIEHQESALASTKPVVTHYATATSINTVWAAIPTVTNVVYVPI